MKTLTSILATIIGAISFSILNAQIIAPEIEWQNTIGGGGGHDEYLYSIQQTTDGGYILGGYSDSDVSFDKTEPSQGSYDYWVVKFNSLGAIEWQNTIGGDKKDYLRSVQQTSDEGYILGGYSQSGSSGDKTEASHGLEDYWVVKLNNSGAIEWQNSIGSSGFDDLFSVQQTDDGGYILGGHSSSGISGDKTEAGLGGYDYWVVKLDNTGAIGWQNTIGCYTDDYLYSIQQTTDGGYILGGSSITGMSDDKTEAGHGWNDYWIVKLDSAGVIEWQSVIGGSSWDKLNSIQQTIDGGYILGGNSESGISGDKTEENQGIDYYADYWVVKLDNTGAIEWQNTIGGYYADELNSIQQTADGGYILGGFSHTGISGDKTEPNIGAADYWIVKLDTAGAIQWQNTIGGSDSDQLFSIQQTSDKGYILGGWSLSDITGDKTEKSHSVDYWVVKLYPFVCNPSTVYADTDVDSYGDISNSYFAFDCIVPPGYVIDSTDCNDADANVNPAAQEILFNSMDDDCDGDIDEFGIGIPSLENSESIFSLFPNPTNGEFVVYLQLNNDLNTEAKIEVINLLGQVVYNRTSELLKGSLQEEIKLYDVADGMYLVRVTVNDQVFSSQIISKK